MASDIAVVSEFGEPILLVEVKNKRGTSRDWAAKLRRNLVAHGFVPKAPFFLVATPDHFYLWKDTGNGAEEIEPDYDIDPSAITRPLFASGEKVGPVEFETKVAIWLSDLLAEQANGVNGELLSHSGLREALRGGRLAFEHEQ